MARIRTVKPEFWTAEQVMECSPIARLLFIGMWNFCDDGGNHPASTKTLKAEVFPGDEISSDEIRRLICELVSNGLLIEYEAGGKAYWHVTGWHHQKIEKPTYKHPKPDIQQPVGNHSTTDRRTVDDLSTPEGKGEEGKGEDVVVDDADASSAAGKAVDPCPHQEIIDLYHRILPMGRQVRLWTAARKAKLRTRWREDEKRQSLDWWERLFTYVADSDFLTGKTHAHDRRPFELDLEWIITPGNMVKIVEGKYHQGAES